MSQRPAIQRIFAGFLLVLFTVSFLPQRFFHDVFANHEDVISCEHPGKNATCVHPQGIRCNFNDLVVTTPYVFNLPETEPIVPVYATVFPCTYASVLLQQCCLHTDSRGPPSIIVA